MRITKLSETRQTKHTTEAFGGYNHNLRISDGEFFNMRNMTSDFYPLASPRAKRRSFEFPTEGTHTPQGIASKDALCIVDDGVLYINGYEISGIALSDTGYKQMVSMGAYLVIFPDEIYINTQDHTDWGYLGQTASAIGTITYTLARVDGTAYSVQTTSGTEPSNPSNGDLWLDTANNVLKQYSSSSSVWVAIATTYVKIGATNIGKDFNIGDAVTLNGITIEELADLNGVASVIQDRGNDYIVVTGFLKAASKTQTSGTVTAERKIPDMDFVIESENRLWGCKYGLNSSGQIVNEIYASKLGDFKNWFVYQGIATDSYAVSVGTDGPFTGAITHLGHPLFFKENCLHKIYGNYPSNYQVQTTTLNGVQKGSGESLAIVGSTLFYKSRDGVCAYDGSLPVDISKAFGDIRYKEASAGVYKNKYYISMKDSDGVGHVFAYDTAKGLWHLEDSQIFSGFCNHDGELYCIDRSNHDIVIVGSGGDEDAIEWSAETGVIGIDRLYKTGSASAPERKYVSSLIVRMALEIGTRVDFYIQYDSIGAWEHACTMTGTKLQSINFPIRPKRCDHFRIRIVGKGDAKIYSIIKTIEEGSVF